MMADEEGAFQIYAVEEEGEGEGGGRKHTLLKIPSILPKNVTSNTNVDKIFNIVMADTSGSMEKRWPLVVNAWQDYIVPKLNGRTRMYAFDYQVRPLGSRKHLLLKDYGGYATDLTAALETVRMEIEQCPEVNIRVFIITDGDHNHNFKSREPETEINQMKAPKGKVISVYLLGIGLEFPVNYSIDIRSRLHNWKANIPTLFWAKEDSEIPDQIQAIGDEIADNPSALKLNVDGYVVPGLDKTSFIHLGEWLYFPQPPEDLPTLEAGTVGTKLQPLTLKQKELSLRLLVDDVFPQWNSVLIQQHRRKAYVPHETFLFMTSLFNSTVKKVKADSSSCKGLRGRLQVKHEKTYALKFATLINQSKFIMSINEKFSDEIKLAETILKTTVTPKQKYVQKVLKFKGHAQKEFEDDAKHFHKIYKEMQTKVLALPTPELDECCSIIASSTLTDLQDPDILVMLEESKYDFMKTFTMTGMPVYVTMTDFSQINPWTIQILHVVGSPFAISSQIALELYSECGKTDFASEDKSVKLQDDMEDTRCNIIIPLVPARAAEVLEPLVCSNLYAMMATFCILRNPNIIDYQAHFAALGCAWLATMRTYPLHTRPEYISERLDSIIATAKCYMSRPSVQAYVQALLDDPDQALMTESTKEFDGHFIRCESLIKPMFLTYLIKHRLIMFQRENMLKILLAEFIGRALLNNVKDKMVALYTELFAKTTHDPKRKGAWLNQNYQNVVKQIKPSFKTILAKFYSPEELQSFIKRHLEAKFAELSSHLLDDDNLCIDMKMIQNLRNIGGCGDVRTTDFKSWAEEMDIPLTSIRKAASPKQIAVYVVEALEHQHSKERVAKAKMTKDEAKRIIREKVQQETSYSLQQKLTNEITQQAGKQWEEEYMTAHKAIVMPMSPAEIIRLAQDKGVAVSHDNFQLVYRYDDHLQLLRNACQLPACPHFLIPHKNFNQHLSFERKQKNFPHALHLVSKMYCAEGAEAVIHEVTKGTLSGTHNRPKPTSPDSLSLAPLKKEITTLLSHYKKDENIIEKDMEKR